MLAFPEIGAYAIDGELGRGAMGVVYRARDTRLDRAAIKALTPEFASDESLLARFEREARWCGCSSGDRAGQAIIDVDREAREAQAPGRIHT
jgi:serine/threonine protein kinase